MAEFHLADHFQGPGGVRVGLLGYFNKKEPLLMLLQGYQKQ